MPDLLAPDFVHHERCGCRVAFAAVNEYRNSRYLLGCRRHARSAMESERTLIRVNARAALAIFKIAHAELLDDVGQQVVV